MSVVHISNPATFYEQGLLQRVCAICGKPGSFQVHHVVPKQQLKRLGLVHRLYDPRNAIRLGDGCHMNLEHGGVSKPIVPTEKLLPENICFIWETLGVAGHNFLARRHTGVDRRFTLHEEGKCKLCQLQPRP